jgi:hypothetical protein
MSMANGKLGIPNDVSNIILGLSGSGLGESLGFTATTTGQVVGCLPIVGIAASLLDLWYTKQQFNEREAQKNFACGEQKRQGFFGWWREQGSIFARSTSAIFLLISSLDVLIETHTFIFNTYSCNLLPVIYTVKSAVDFVEACAALGSIINKENGIKSQTGKTACADVLAKAMTLAGWALLACGYPLGWMFLAVTIVPHTARLLSGCGLLKQKSPIGALNPSQSGHVRRDFTY